MPAEMADSRSFLPRAAWETHHRDAKGVGADMAEFAIGSLATMASLNPRIQMVGSVPYLGSHLTVCWRDVIALFVCIVGIHFALFASAIWATRVVVIKDDSTYLLHVCCALWLML